MTMGQGNGIGSGSVPAGTEVVGSDGQYVGIAGETSAENGGVLVTERRTGGDIYVPFAAFTGMQGNRATVNLPAADVDLQNWPHPSTAGTVGGSPANPGPAGTGMPTGQPGWPTFEGTGRDNPGAGAGNLVSDPKAEFPEAPTPSSLARNPAAQPLELELDTEGLGREGTGDRSSD